MLQALREGTEPRVKMQDRHLPPPRPRLATFPPPSQRRGTGSLHLAKEPRMRRLGVPLLAGVMLSCLGVFLSLPATGSDVPSAFVAGTDGAHGDRDANTPLPDGSYLLTPAEEVQKTDKRPVNVELLTILLLACSFGASVGWLLTNARRRGAICSSGVDRQSLVTPPEGPSFLGVFRL